MAMTRVCRALWRAVSARARRVLTVHCWTTGRRKSAKRRTVKRLPRSTAARIGRSAARLTPMDGILDWYWLGVVVGLGVPPGAAFLRGPIVYVLAAAATLAIAVIIVALALPAWAFGAAGGSTALGWLSLR